MGGEAEPGVRWRIDPQASVQLSNLGVAEADVLEQLPAPQLQRGKLTVDVDGPLVVLAAAGAVLSVRRPPVPASKPAKPVALTKHAQARAATRGITDDDIAAALAAPRGAGGVHTAGGVTVVVRTKRRAGERVATVWR